MVIGENPAVKLDVDWWAFWDDDAGYDRPKFDALFRGKSAGRTRRAIQRLLDPLEAAGHSCLVTNRYRNENLGGYRGQDGSIPSIPNDEVLKILLAELRRLKAVVRRSYRRKPPLITHLNPGAAKLKLWIESPLGNPGLSCSRRTAGAIS
jgi:hypothetical protein